MKVTLHAFCTHCGKMVHTTIDTAEPQFPTLTQFMSDNPPQCLWCVMDMRFNPEPFSLSSVFWSDDIDGEDAVSYAN